jgi:flavin reductase (DIM6/NTAB) family NADH-FMN oxidoreductase RutF
MQKTEPPAMAQPAMAQGDRMREYRNALGRFPTGVAFVAARSPEGEAAGLLINSFTSVSLSPPLVLWCLGLSASSRGVFSRAPSFAISLLAEDQRALLADLSRPLADRLSGVATREGWGGAPVLAGAAAVLECQVTTVTRAGDHEVYMGEVKHFERGEGAPLAYLAGKYGRVHLAA